MSVFRLEPAMSPDAYTTYQAVRPTATHTRRVTCQEADCQAYANGWQTVIDVSTPLGRRQADYIRMRSGRHYTVTPDGDRVIFRFPPGQRCFAEHRADIDKPTIFLKRGGDWRASTLPAVRMSAADWVDDFATHQNELAETIEKG